MLDELFPFWHIWSTRHLSCLVKLPPAHPPILRILQVGNQRPLSRWRYSTDFGFPYLSSLWLYLSWHLPCCFLCCHCVSVMLLTLTLGAQGLQAHHHIWDLPSCRLCHIGSRGRGEGDVECRYLCCNQDGWFPGNTTAGIAAKWCRQWFCHSLDSISCWCSIPPTFRYRHVQFSSILVCGAELSYRCFTGCRLKEETEGALEPLF